MTSGTVTKTNNAPSSQEMPAQDFLQWIKSTMDEAIRELGHINLLAVGNTGAGKSTLINSIFGWEVAETGNGRPVTQGTTAYAHPHLPITFFDTRGIEIGEEKSAIRDRLVSEIERRRRQPVDEQIHVAWYTVRWSDRRLEDGQADMINALAASGVPVLLVMTQVPEQNGECHPDAVGFAQSIFRMGLPLQPGSGVFLTAAIDDPWTGRAHGLQRLLKATFEVIPEGARSALVAAQQINEEYKWDASMEIATQHAALAAAAAASPIPFSDAAAIVPIQITMISRITSVWGLDVSRQTLANVIGSALLTSGATFLGRQLIGGLLKLIPGVGWLAGTALNAGVAGTITTGAGIAWARVMQTLADDPNRLREMSDEEIKIAFRKALTEHHKKSRRC